MLKTVIEIRRSSARDTLIAQSVYLNSLLDWEPAEKLKQRCDVVIYIQRETHTQRWKS